MSYLFNFPIRFIFNCVLVCYYDKKLEQNVWCGKRYTFACAVMNHNSDFNPVL